MILDEDRFYKETEDSREIEDREHEPISVIELLDKARRSEPDRDPTQAAISDLYGCDRATWFRRNGFTFPDRDDATLRKFDVGHAVEAQIVTRLRSLGKNVQTGLRVALRVTDGELIGRYLSDDEEPWDDEVGGHPDILSEGTLIEIKTTDVRKPESAVKLHYALQTAAYAIATDADDALVHVTHVANFTKDEVEYRVFHESWRPRVTQRVEEVLARTAPGASMPDADPPFESAEWICKYCPVAQCERNANRNAEMLVGAEVF